MKVDRFKPQRFWDNIDPTAYRYGRLGYLSINFREALQDLTNKNGNNNNNSSLLNEILTQNNAGPIQKTYYNDLRRNLDKYFVEIYWECKNRGTKFMTNEELYEKGFSENLYKSLLKQFSEFLAWMYDVDIPYSIKEMYKDIVESNDMDEMQAELEQLSIDDLAENPGNRAPILFIIDNSLSMEGDAFGQLQHGLEGLFDELEADVNLKYAVELYISTSGNGPNEIVNFATIERQRQILNTIELKCKGKCLMGATINMALDKLEERISVMKNGDIDVAYYTPWLIILSNGKFKDDMENVFERIQNLREKHELQVYPIGLNKNVNMDALRKLDKKEAKILTSVNGFFKDIYSSLKMIEKSTPGGDRVTLVHQEGFKP